ncbi:MAG: hypothetical protein M8364_15525 [Methylobacter sp.]|uniref:hypothetical protein n=1 Tax=Methylobacter sp. TaxID=2051955 RepID=UPI00258C584E|nr:hypothetical protein [Methylobacter sp.]MCL7422301.1 hypothetical protein [Methylobacter sp.]
MLSETKYLRTDKFEHREVKEHSINPCCFGEDFAEWLSERINNISRKGFSIGEPIQEDYGWGFWVEKDKDPFWIAISYAEEGPVEESPYWIVAVAYDPGLNIFRRLFGKPNMGNYSELRDEVWRALDAEDEIEKLSEAEWANLA